MTNVLSQGIYNSPGTVVTEYKYDAWGNTISITGSLASSVGNANPFRYRGYYYDSEMGLFYVGSRYYDPEIGRFINADGEIAGIGQIQGNNMFQYCFNNPVNMEDNIGCLPKWLKKVVAVVAVVAVVTAVVVVSVATVGVATTITAVAVGATAGVASKYVEDVTYNIW